MRKPIDCTVGRVVTWDCPCGQHFKQEEKVTRELVYTVKYLCSCGRWLLLQWDADLFGTKIEDISPEEQEEEEVSE